MTTPADVIAKVEARVQEVLKNIVANRQAEKLRIELKTQWPAPEERYKTAREIAAHANAARGEPILWIIGANERQGVVSGAPRCEVENWYAPHRKHFDGELMPQLLDTIVVPFGDISVVTLRFDTTRAPYVIKVPHHDGCSCQYEVPYRRGNHPFSARREEMMQILVPQLDLPAIEFLDVGAFGHSTEYIRLHVVMYVTVPGCRRAILPRHRCSIGYRLELDEPYCSVEPAELWDEESDGRGRLGPQLAIDGGARIGMAGRITGNPVPLQGRVLDVRVEIGLAGADRKLTFTHRLRSSDRGGWIWER